MKMGLKIAQIVAGMLIGCVCQATIPDQVIYEKLKKIAQISPTTSIQRKVLQDKINELANMQFDANAIIDKEMKKTPLMMVVDIPDEQAALQLIDIFIKKGADVNKLDPSGDVPALYFMAINDKPLIVKKLLKYGADPLIKSKNGNTAVHLFAARGFAENLKVLLDHLKDQEKLKEALYDENNSGDTVFLSAVKSLRDYHEIKKIVDLLLDYGADPNYMNSKGESVISYLKSQKDSKSKKLYSHIKQKLLYLTHKALEKIPAAREDITMRVSEYLGVEKPKKPEPEAELPKAEIVSQEESMSEVD